MGKQAKCGYCGELIAKDSPTKKYNNKTYHLHCYNKLCEEKYAEIKNNTQDGAREKLYEYICKLFNITELSSFLNFQLNKIFKENNFTYNGVLYSLKYYYEIKDNKPNIEYGIGIVPVIYDEAKNFYLKKSILRKKNDVEASKTPPKQVLINPDKLTKGNQKPFVDINTL